MSTLVEFLKNFLMSPVGTFSTIASFLGIVTWIVVAATRKVTKLEMSQKHLEQGHLNIVKKIDQLASDMRDGFQKMDERFEKVEQTMDERFEKVDERFEKMEQKMDKKFEKMEQKTDKRFEKMDRQFEKINERIGKVEEDISEIREDVSTLKADVKILQNNYSIIKSKPETKSSRQFKRRNARFAS